MKNQGPQARSKLRTRRSVLFGGAIFATAGVISVNTFLGRATASAEGGAIVYKTPTCGCCAAWVEHITAAGFKPRIVEMADLTPIRSRFGAPDDLMSCHIAVVDGYVVEGHVPQDAIKKLLAERPEAVGLFVPGMPLGSPGMESPYGLQPYDVILLRRDGRRETFASYNA